MAKLTEAQAIDAVMAAAEALRAAFKAVQAIPFGYDHKPDGLDELLDEKTYLGDLDTVANALAIKADEWQIDYDERCSAAHEEDDRHRANALSPNYRAYS